ncbi:MAG TPA: biotin/lipoyl-containing protein [Polyangiaceae bacterium]|nr:biotin/lipoyl-containing protein [Polyangiaceae bacterium]
MKRLNVEVEGEVFETESATTGEPGAFDVLVRSAENARRAVRVLRQGDDPLVLVGERVVSLRGFRERAREREVHYQGAVRRAIVTPPGAGQGRGNAAGESALTSPMPGRIVAISVKPGDHVEAGSLLLVIEAMKMQNELHAKGAAVIEAVLVKPGDTVERGATLVKFG